MGPDPPDVEVLKVSNLLQDKRVRCVTVLGDVTY
jgi:hypothetical protein